MSPQERSYYDTLFTLAGPDITGVVSGKQGALFFSASGLARDVLHKIWAIADIGQQGKLGREDFDVACRLIAHAQSGLTPDPSLVNREPGVLPILEGLKRPSSSVTLSGKQDFDVISLSDPGVDANTSYVDPVRASNIALSLSKLGIDPLEFIPFQSGPDVQTVSDWKITEVNKSKYSGLFTSLDKDSPGYVDGKTARRILEKSGLNRQLLGLIWELSDADSDGRLNETEFIVAMHLTTKCKKGCPLPSEVPAELAEQLKESKKAPVEKTEVRQPPSRQTDWKYSRTYLGVDESIDRSAVETEKRLRSGLAGAVDETEEEMRYNADLCAQVESDVQRMKIELDKRTSLLAELERNKQELTDKKGSVMEMRRTLNFDKISLNRDKSKLQSEILHLRRLAKEATQDVHILRGSVRETELDIERILVQTTSLDGQRRDAVRQHSEELSKIEAEQRETAELVDSWARLGREDGIRLESERIRAEKDKLIAAMQRSPLQDARLTATSAFSDNGSKWATTLLKPDSKRESNIGFGTTFFNPK